MVDILARAGQAISLGRAGENGCRRIVFDVSAWEAEFPGAEFGLLNLAPGAEAAYPAIRTDAADGALRWTVESRDVPAAGRGRCELLAVRDDVIVKSEIFDTVVLEALDGSAEAPDVWESWQTEFARRAAEARKAADDAEAAWEAVAGMSVDAITLPPGSAATANYSAGRLAIGVPQGLRGETGPQGPTGETYALTEQDRREIAEAVLAAYPPAEEVSF